MISLEQVRQLDIRVKKAVTAVRAFTQENADLKGRIAVLEAQLDTLRREASDRRADDQQLEVSFQGVLDVLDGIDEGPSGFGSVPGEQTVSEKSGGLSPEPAADEDEPAADGEPSVKTGEPVILVKEPDDLQDSSFIDDDAETAEEDGPVEKASEEAESDNDLEIPEDVQLDEDEDGTSDRGDKFQSEFDIF